MGGFLLYFLYMRLFERYHFNDLHKLFHTDFWLFELSIWLHVLARSMISVFIPILLLTMGWEIKYIILFYLIYNVFDIPLNFFVKWLLYKIGARVVLILGTASYICFFVVLYFLNVGDWSLLILMAWFAAMYDALFWVGHMYYFMSCEKNDRNVSKGLSYLHIAKRIAGVLAPAIGAVILIFFKEHILIIVSAVLLIFSVWPLFKIKNSQDRPSKKPMNMKQFFPKGKGLKEYFIMSLTSFNGVADGVIWPIFIFVLFGTIESVAIIPIIVSITVIIFTFFVGKIKKGNRAKVIALGALLIAITWISRIIFDNTVYYYISIFLLGFFSILVTMPLESNILEEGEKKDSLATATYRNFFSMWPRVILYGVLFLLLEVFNASFIIAAGTMLVIMAINIVFVLKKPAKSLKNI